MAIDESLWCGFDDSDDFYIRRYNIALGEWSDIYAWGDIVAGKCGGMLWDGAHHIWIFESDEATPENCKYKKLNIYDQSIEDWNDLPLTKLFSTAHNGMSCDFGSKLVFLEQNNDGLVYDYATKVFGQTPPAFSGNVTINSGIACIPPWAINEPGNWFATKGHGNLDFDMFDPIAGGWAGKQNLLGTVVSPYGQMVWADGSGTEYIYLLRAVGHFDKYNVNTNVWSRIGNQPATPNNYSYHSLAWDGDNYLFFHADDDVIYRFDLTTETWGSYVNYPATAHVNSVVYTPRIRFMYQDSGNNILTDPISLGSLPKDRTSGGVKYYLKALEAEALAVTIGVVTDPRTDADDKIELADDVAGSPNVWGADVNLGAFNLGEEIPFWIRVNPGGGMTQEAKIARLDLTFS